MAELPRPGELWADFECDPPDVVSIDSVDDDGTIWLWVMGRDYAGSYRLDEFLTRYQRAWVVPADAPDDQAAMHQTARVHGAFAGEPVTRYELESTGRSYLLELPENEFWKDHYFVDWAPILPHPGADPWVKFTTFTNEGDE